MARIRLINVALIDRGLEADVDIGTATIPPLAVGRRVRLSNVSLIAGGLEGDAEALDASPPPPPPPPGNILPTGYNSDADTAYWMLAKAVTDNHLDPIAVQGHGQQIVDALNRSWPGLDVYRSPSDAPVWPGFGSIDVTIDSGKRGWAFRPDGVTRYEPDPTKRG